jgi:hypothetical protein
MSRKNQTVGIWVIAALALIGLIGNVEHNRRVDDQEVYLKGQETAKQAWVDKKVKILMSFPAAQVVVREGDSPSSLCQRNGISESAYSIQAINASFEKLNPGARLWPGDLVTVPKCDKVAQK